MGADRRAEHRAYYQAHKERAAQRNRAWKAANAAHLRAYKQVNVERDQKKQAEWRKKNPDKTRAASWKWHAVHGAAYREKTSEARAGWCRKNSGRFRAYAARRKAARLAATPAWVDLNAIRAIYDDACRRGVEVDHIVPLRGKTVCGLHVSWNLQLLTRSENMRKGNRLEHDSQPAVSPSS